MNINSLLESGRFRSDINKTFAGAVLSEEKQRAAGGGRRGGNMRHYLHRPPCMYAEAAGALADYLAPHQVAVGVPGGLDILVHGVRAYLRAQPELVVVRLDLRNAYNEIDRCAALRRLAAVPELAHLAPLFHVLHAPVARLQLSTGRSLFDGVAGRESDSEEGMRHRAARAG